MRTWTYSWWLMMYRALFSEILSTCFAVQPSGGVCGAKSTLEPCVHWIRLPLASRHRHQGVFWRGRPTKRSHLEIREGEPLPSATFREPAPEEQHQATVHLASCPAGVNGDAGRNPLGPLRWSLPNCITENNWSKKKKIKNLKELCTISKAANTSSMMGQWQVKVSSSRPTTRT